MTVVLGLCVLAPLSAAMPPYRLWRLQARTDNPAIFPHVRCLREAGVVEFDGQIAVHAHADDGSVVFLEVVACRPDTKEHEALVVSPALASHVHAALLLLEAEPGRPGGWDWIGQTLRTIEPAGTPLAITIAWADETGKDHEHAATDLIVNRADGRTLTEACAGEGISQHSTAAPGTSSFADQTDPMFVFAGSRFVARDGSERYDADGTGLIVGLHTFGSETVAFKQTMSPEASVSEPEWIASRELLPARGTPVVVRIRLPK